MKYLSPAPWTAKDARNDMSVDHPYWSIVDANGDIVARVEQQRSPQAEWDNARLLAAVPDLYAALDALLLQPDEANRDKAAAALARARGRSQNG